jgi:hypothetical protein
VDLEVQVLAEESVVALVILTPALLITKKIVRELKVA